jgi:hypothetical protein
MSIDFTIDADPAYAWTAWGNMSYDSVADVIGELIDNCIQAMATQCQIDIVESSSQQRYITIEDDSIWDTINEKTLIKCFGYGKGSSVKKEGLNEHNCGLKHSLAYMDPENSRWKIQIKKDGEIWELKAPYSHVMKLSKISVYDGVISKSNGTYIKIPLDDTQFKTLYYQKSVKGRPNAKMLTDRLRLYLECFWMMNNKIVKREFNIRVNEKVVEPYDILRDKNVKLGNQGKIQPVEKSLSENSPKITVEIWHLDLTSDFEKSYNDHPIFRRSPQYCGAYIFKHGRLIKGSIFPEIYGLARDYHYSGHLVLVNITGDSNGLPATHTTKNNFNNKDPKLEGLYAHIKDTTPPLQSKQIDRSDKKCENERMRLLYLQKTSNNKKKIEKGEYRCYQHESFKLHNENGEPLLNKEQCDLVEYDKRDKAVTIYEGKVNSITVDDCRQLFFYYRNLKYYYPEFKDCTFDLKFIVIDNRKTQAVTDELYMLKQLDPLFDVEIETFKDYGL